MAVEEFIAVGAIIKPPQAPEGVLANRAGTFVTLRTLDHQLRGCIGTIEPAQPNVASEIIQNAVRAAIRDPRFPPVTTHELPRLTYGVDVLSPPERVNGPEDLDPSIYGVIIVTLDGSQRSLLLPRIAGIETVDQQWEAVHLKGGIRPGTPVRVERFSVTRFGSE